MVKVILVTNNPRTSFIVPETKTVREILEDRNVSYANASIQVDGEQMDVSDLDQTLQQLNIQEKTTISVLAHKDNNANACIHGSACIVTSKLKLEDIQRIKRLRPEMLTLVNEDNEDDFMIDVDEEGPGSMNENGALFSSTTDKEGHATITILMDPTEENKAEVVYQKLGLALEKLETLENGLKDMMPDLSKIENDIRGCIVVM